MAANLTIQVPSFVTLSHSDFTEGIVIVSAPDLDEQETDALDAHIRDQLGSSVEAPALIVVNFGVEVLLLDEEKMRKMGWVRAPE
jgi:hypothetical protein